MADRDASRWSMPGAGIVVALTPAVVLAVAGTGGDVAIAQRHRSPLAGLAGILLCVQAFLFTGVAFLALTIFTQIWHAAHDLEQTWLWWVCGILLGIAILTLFALFEKRKADVLRLVEDVKQWR